MRTLTPTLTAAQRKSGSRPTMKVIASNISGGVARLDWERLYIGVEEDHFHALAVPGDGSLVRVRLTPPAQAGRLYRQRVVSPGPESNFSAWVYTGQYNVAVVSAAACGAEVSIVWIRSNREIRRIVSTDNGATWSGSELIDYAPTTTIQGLAAAYRPDGGLALFYAVQNDVYCKQRISGVWQSTVCWDKSAGMLNGIAAVYGGDWELLVTGQDTGGNPVVWGLAYGDDYEAAAGTWSDLIELATAPAGEDFSYRQPFLDVPDVFRSSWMEDFSGTAPLQRPFLSHTIPENGFAAGLWREPSPADMDAPYGLALAHDTNYLWATCPSGVWRAPYAAREIDVSADVSLLRQTSLEESGSLDVALCNDTGRYAFPGQGDLSVLQPGCRLRVSPGYVTADGEEYSDGPGFRLESLEHVGGGGKAGLVLHGKDGWASLAEWKARQQFRWNRTGPETCVRDIIAFVLARAGLRLVTVSASALMTGFCPDFTIGPGMEGATAVRRLLAYVPDVLFCEDETVYAVNPLAGDLPVYGYGSGHRVSQSSHLRAAPETNHVLVEGWDGAAGERILVESTLWSEAGRFPERRERIGDRNIGSVASAAGLADARLRKVSLEAVSGSLVVPVNCGQQMYDVVSITDASAGLDEAPRRVLGIAMTWNPARGDYSQKLKLGAV